MEIRIESPQFSTTAAIGGHLRDVLQGHLAHCGERVRGVDAYLADVNGHRGGADKRCRLVVHLDRARAVVAESTQADLYRAIRRAAVRAGRAVAQRIGRETVRRRPRREVLDEDRSLPAD